MKLEFKDLIKKLKKIRFERFDLIVAIGRDGIIPASLIQHYLKIPMEILWVNFRDKNNNPIRKNPILTKPLNNNLKKIKDKKILLVDNVSKTGKTLVKAKKLLNGNKVKTFVINGKADYSIYNIKECMEWPW